MLQAELGTRLRAELHQHIGKPGAVRAGLAGLRLRPSESVEDDPLDVLQALGGAQFLIDDGTPLSSATTRESAA